MNHGRWDDDSDRGIGDDCTIAPRSFTCLHWMLCLARRLRKTWIEFLEFVWPRNHYMTMHQAEYQTNYGEIDITRLPSGRAHGAVKE